MEIGRTETDALPGHAECTVIQKNTVFGGDKPLHRFIMGQPKIIGIIVVILGSSFFILSIPMKEVSMGSMDSYVQPGFWLGPMLSLTFPLFSSCNTSTLAILPIERDMVGHNSKQTLIKRKFIVCGILYILTEYNPTKKTVTASFAVSILALLGALWVAFIKVLPFLLYLQHMGLYGRSDQHLVLILYMLFEIYIFVGVLIFFTMSVLAGASLRSTHRQTQIVMMQSQLSTE